MDDDHPQVSGAHRRRRHRSACASSASRPSSARPCSSRSSISPSPERSTTPISRLVLIDAECTDHLFELIATFRQVRPQLKLIVLGNETIPEYIQRVIGAGAKGYLRLTAKEAEIRMAIEMVRDGSVWAPRKVLSRLLDRQPAAPVRRRAPRTSPPANTRSSTCFARATQPRDRRSPRHRRKHSQGAHRPPDAQSRRQQPHRPHRPSLHPARVEGRPVSRPNLRMAARISRLRPQCYLRLLLTIQ